jgi:hypothetical protein
MTGGLLNDQALQASAVVANNAMNRERQLAGVNSRELGFNPLDRLTARIESQGPYSVSVGWLDLCGTGRALLHAAEHLAAGGLSDRITLVGVDVVDFVDPTRDPVRRPNWYAPRSRTGSHRNGSTSSPASTGCTTSATSWACSPARRPG